MHVQQIDLDINDKKGLHYLLISAPTFELRELKHLYLPTLKCRNPRVSWRTKVMTVVTLEMPPLCTDTAVFLLALTKGPEQYSLFPRVAGVRDVSKDKN